MMTKLHFVLLLVGIIVLGAFCGIIVGIISNKRKKSILADFSNCSTYRKFTDQNDPSIDEVAKKFKLLDD